MVSLYGRRWVQRVEVSDGMWFDVTYTVQRAEPDVGIMSDYIELMDFDGPDMDPDEAQDLILTALYRELDI